MYHSGCFVFLLSCSLSFIPSRLLSQILQTNSKVGQRDGNIVSSQELSSAAYSCSWWQKTLKEYRMPWSLQTTS